MSERIILSPPERRTLKRLSRSRRVRAEEVRRATIILGLARGDTPLVVSRRERCSVNTVKLWRGRFQAERIAGLWSRHAGRKTHAGTGKLEARILDWTLHRKPTDGSTHWSSRKLAAALKIDHMRVARVWAKAGLQPHRRRHYMASDDPDFEQKAATVLGLYLQPPTHAAVFCVDEKTAIQALDRLDPVLPLSPGRAEAHGFEYYRHGTLSLYAALNTASGQVLAKTAARHTSAEFVAFLGRSGRQPARRPRHPHHRRQPVGAQDQAGGELSGRTPARPTALHSHLQLVAQPGGDLVFQDPTRLDFAGHLYLQRRSAPQDHALHPTAQPPRRALQMDLQKHRQPHPLTLALSSVTVH